MSTKLIKFWKSRSPDISYPVVEQRTEPTLNRRPKCKVTFLVVF